MAAIDYAIVALFFCVIFASGVLFYRWVADADDFYVAGRRLTPFILAATLTATNVNLFSFIGQAGQAGATGISMIWQTWTGNMALVIAGLFVIPVMRRLKMRTVPEFLEVRYGRSARMLVAAVIFLRLAFWLGVIVGLAAIVAQSVTGAGSWHFWIITFAIITIAYTVLGGMWSVALTDVLQFILMMGGALVILPLIMSQIGWWPGLKAGLPEGHLALVRTTGTYNWAFILAISLLGIQWASTDQGLIQRAFGADSTKTVAKGMVLAGIITTPFAFLWILPGLASNVFFAQRGIEVAADHTIPVMLSELLAPGLLGIVLCGFLASQMSTIDSNLSAAATLFVNDIFGRIRKSPPSDRTLLWVVRLVTLVAGVFMVGFAWYLRRGVGAVGSYLGLIAMLDMPLFVIVVLFGFFSKRANLPGALIGYFSGALGGFIAMLLTANVAEIANSAEAITLWQVLVEGGGFLRISIEAVTTAAFLGGNMATATFVSGGAAVAGVLVGSLVGKRPTSRELEPVTTARQVSQEERDTGNIYNIWPVSFCGKLCVIALAVAFAVFLLGAFMGSFAPEAGSIIAPLAMLVFFLAGLARLAFD